MLTARFYLAAAIFLRGRGAARVAKWAFTPEPFRIPTTSGQQPSVAGIRHSRVESPATRAGVVGRMLLEVLLFRSLFRNTAPGRTEPGSHLPAAGLLRTEGPLDGRAGLPLVAAVHRHPPPASVRGSGSGHRERRGGGRRVLRDGLAGLVRERRRGERGARLPPRAPAARPAAAIPVAAGRLPGARRAAAGRRVGNRDAVHRAGRPRGAADLHARPGRVSCRRGSLAGDAGRAATGSSRTCCRCRACSPSCRSRS